MLQLQLNEHVQKEQVLSLPKLRVRRLPANRTGGRRGKGPGKYEQYVSRLNLIAQKLELVSRRLPGTLQEQIKTAYSKAEIGANKLKFVEIVHAKQELRNLLDKANRQGVVAIDSKILDLFQV